MVDSPLNVSEVDFSTLKSNFITFLQNQNKFSDYNFQGSGISILLDILAYNTHVNASYANLAFAETFLDSAVQPGSINSRAKELNYLPRSMSAAQATITLNFSVTGNPSQYTIPAGTLFTSSANGVSFTFVTNQDYLVDNVGNTFTQEMTIYQGQFTSFQYIANLNDTSQKFIIPSFNIDKNFLTVLFKNSITDTLYDPFVFVDEVSIGDLKPTAQIFFLKINLDGYYEAYFGDDIIAYKIQNGNVVKLTYLLTNGPDANGCKVFTLGSSLPDVTNLAIVTNSPAFGGSDAESEDSIAFNAPLSYQAAGNAVTTDDYKSIVPNKYSNVNDIVVWGGEDNDPPYYGRVFIAIDPVGNGTVPTLVKQAIASDIQKKYSIVGITPVIVDPDYITVKVSTTVTYNARLYNQNSSINLNTAIREAITTFFTQQVNKFGKALFFSNLTAAIKAVSPLIIDNVTNLTLSKELQIFSGISGQYTFTFNNAISPGSVISNEIVINGTTWRIKDIPDTSLTPPQSGKIAVYRMVGNNTIYLIQDTGTVDYTTGAITINNLRIDSILNDPISKMLSIQVSPGPIVDPNNPSVVYLDDNIYTDEKSQIITLANNGISITLLPTNNV